MIFIVLAFYAVFTTYDILYLHNNNFKKEIPIYIFLISISIIISSLIALKIDIPDPMIYFRKFLEWLKSILGLGGIL